MSRVNFAPEPLFNDRKEFFRHFFPKWSGFRTDSDDDKIQLMEALQNLHCLVYDTIGIWTSSSGCLAYKPVDNNQLDLGKVYTQKVITPFN